MKSLYRNKKRKEFKKETSLPISYYNKIINFFRKGRINIELRILKNYLNDEKKDENLKII